jgi:hypothetical protein
MPENSSPLDAEWFPKLLSASNLSLFEYLDGDAVARERTKQQFFAGDIHNPVFEYPFIDLQKIATHQALLTDLQNELLSKETNPLVIEVYQNHITLDLAKIDLLRAVAVGDMVAFQKNCSLLYGNPPVETFQDLLSFLYKKVIPLVNGADTTAQKLAKNLLQKLPPVSAPTERDITCSTPEIFFLAQKYATEHFAPLTALVNLQEEKVYTAPEIQVVFLQGLATLGFTEWQVVISRSSKSAINTNNQQKTIFIPEKREVDAETLRDLLVHEIGCHVSRQMNGAKLPLKLLSLGLAHYDNLEEGLATFSAQALHETFEDFAGAERTLSIGLALGLDGTPRDFRGVFEILVPYYQLMRHLDPTVDETGDELLLGAREAAWLACVRTFRGTDCHTPGTCFTKDHIYREGNITAWQIFAQNPAWFPYLYLGKYSPNKAGHRKLLFELGIIPKALL